MKFKMSNLLPLVAVALATSLMVKAQGAGNTSPQTPAETGAEGTASPQGAPGNTAPGGMGAGGAFGRGRGGPGPHGLGNSSVGIVQQPGYNTTPPELPADLKPGGVLIYSKTNGFRDEPAVEASDAALSAIARMRGLQYFVTENGAVMTPETLSKFNLVIWNNNSGDTLNEDQKNAFKAWLEKGGVYFGIHGAGGDPAPVGARAAAYAGIRSESNWQWYVDDILTVQFVGHSRIQPADIHVEDTKSPLAKGLPAVWHRSDEWYAFSTNPRSKPGVHVIAAVDEKTYDPGAFSMGADHPSIWWHCVGNGRALFSALGHGAEMYQEPLMIQFLDNAMAWGLNSKEGRACPAKN